MFGVQPRITSVDDQRIAKTLPLMRPIETSRAAVFRRSHERTGTMQISQRYQVGDQVLLARSADQNRKDRSLHLRWDGPYTILEARPPTYSLLEANRRRRSRDFVHERRLTL